MNNPSSSAAAVDLVQVKTTGHKPMVVNVAKETGTENVASWVKLERLDTVARPKMKELADKLRRNHWGPRYLWDIFKYFQVRSFDI